MSERERTPPKSIHEEPLEPPKVDIDMEGIQEMVELLRKAAERVEEVHGKPPLRDDEASRRWEEIQRLREAEEAEPTEPPPMTPEMQEVHEQLLFAMAQIADSYDRERGIPIPADTYTVTAAEIRMTLRYLYADSELDEQQLDEVIGLGRGWFRRLVLGEGEVAERDAAVALRAFGKEPGEFFREMHTKKLEDRWWRFGNRRIMRAFDPMG